MPISCCFLRSLVLSRKGVMQLSQSPPRSICGGQWRGLTHHTPACWSTSAGRSPHDGREDSPGGIVARKAGLAHARAVVNDEHGGIIIHGELISNRRAFKRLSFLFFTLSIPSKYFFSLSWLWCFIVSSSSLSRAISSCNVLFSCKRSFSFLQLRES